MANWTLARAESPAAFESGRRILEEYCEFIQALIPKIAEVVRKDFDSEFARFPSQYESPEGELWLAWQQGQVVGCVALRRLGGNRLELERLYVQPSHRHSGLGTALTLKCIDVARSIGARQLILVTSPPYLEAVRLYRRLGFCEVEVENDPDLARYGTSHAIILGISLR